MAKTVEKLVLQSTPADEFEAAIEADIQRPEHRYLQTPLLQALTSGALPKESIKDYAMLRWAFQAHANPAMMLSHACFLLGDDVEHLLENVYDEIFRPKGEGDHPGLWVEFARRLGATDAELDEVANNPLAEVIGFPRTMTYFTRQGAPEGLTTWYADEAQLPEAHGATALALRKYYGLDDQTIEYFLEHVRADLEHSQANESLIGRYIRTRDDVIRARRAGAVTLWAWREMHEGIHRAIRKKHGIA
jgi:pyrroloquinoline quinone (PQQ) biosynthesis protein C